MVLPNAHAADPVLPLVPQVDNLNIFDDVEGPQFDDAVATMYRKGGKDAFHADSEVDWEGLSRAQGFNVWDNLGRLKEQDKRPPTDEPMRDDGSSWF